MENNEEIKIEEHKPEIKPQETESKVNNETESKNESTEVEVTDSVPIEKSDIVPAETIKNELSKIDAEHKKYLQDRIKESEIKWDEIEFEDDTKEIPKLTEEDKKLFITIIKDYFDRDLLDLYIDEAVNTINEYKQIRSVVESGDADEADISYFKELSKGYQDSKVALASIQQESRQIAKEFKESKIAEDYIKSVTLKSLRDFIVGKFRYTMTLKEPNKLHNFSKDIEMDRVKQIEDSLLHNMYVTTMFSEYLLRHSIHESYSNKQKFNYLRAEYVKQSLFDYTTAMKIYIKNIKDKINIDISAIKNRDFKAFEFFKAVLIYVHIYHNDERITKSMKQSDIDLIKSKLDFTAHNKEWMLVYDQIYNDITKLVNHICDISTLEKLIIEYNKMLHEDSKYKELGIIDETNYKDTIVDISSHFPEVIGTNISEWCRWYILMKKYETWYTFYDFKQKLELKNSDKGIDNDKLYSEVFGIILMMFSDFYDYLYGEFIVDIDEFVTHEVSVKDSRSFVFGILMNNLVLQHDLGYKTNLVTDSKDENGTEVPGNYKGEKLYDLAKDTFGKDQFDYFVVDQKDDILLKDVDLFDTRFNYVSIVADAVDFFNNCFDRFDEDNGDDSQQIIHSSKKKSKKKNHKKHH